LPTEELVGGILETYAARALFRGFSGGPVRGGRAVFKMLWHRDRVFELILDVPRKTLRFPVVLPEVPADSAMYRELREYIESRFADSLPEHRRIDAKKVRIRCGNRGGNVSLTLTALDGDFDYAVRKLIHVVHEVYMDFLLDGRYYEYMVEKFDLDPDRM
jgi:hypothetical protein